jgi:hypothetical protein
VDIETKNKYNRKQQKPGEQEEGRGESSVN